jgi:hypothetical protein
MLISLDRELGYQDSISSSRMGESMFRSLSGPRILCAFDNLCAANNFADTGDLAGAGKSAGSMSISLIVALYLRPGTGKRNLEVRPILSDDPSLKGWVSIS